MRGEYNSVLSTPTEADNIGRFGRYRYLGKTQISADISVDLQVNVVSIVCTPYSKLKNIKRSDGSTHPCVRIHYPQQEVLTSCWNGHKLVSNAMNLLPLTCVVRLSSWALEEGT